MERQCRALVRHCLMSSDNMNAQGGRHAQSTQAPSSAPTIA